MLTRINLCMLPIAAILVLFGQRALGLSVFVLALVSLEIVWWGAHPNVERSFSARWENSLRFYEKVHLDPWNRLLHIFGIPFVWLGSFACVFAPLHGVLWWIGAASFGLGWAFNGIGHMNFEPSSGAYEEGSVDPLSVFSSVFWDLSQMKRTLRECKASLVLQFPSLYPAVFATTLDHPVMNAKQPASDRQPPTA